MSILNPSKSDNSTNISYIKTEDGHWVRSRGEALIANGLYYRKIRYEYEKTIWINTNTYLITDFYLPDYDIYLEYWGLENSEYKRRREKKEKSYSDLNLRLFSIENQDIRNLDKYLNKLTLCRSTASLEPIIKSISLIESKLLRSKATKPLYGGILIAKVNTNPFTGLTSKQNNYVQFNILQQRETAIVRVYGQYEKGNLIIATNLSKGDTVIFLNPVLPPSDYISAEIWINEHFSKILTGFM